MPNEPIVPMAGITKDFTGVQALEAGSILLEGEPARIHGPGQPQVASISGVCLAGSSRSRLA